MIAYTNYFIYRGLGMDQMKLNISKRQITYIIKIFILSFLLFSVIGSIFKTEDGTISYFLSLISSHFIVKELNSLK